MDSCSSCGSSIPDGQGVCSMCYGDPEYGQDGYYRDFLNELDQERTKRQREEEEYILELNSDTGSADED